MPPALYDKYWVAYQQAGQLGTTARILLPNERILAAGEGLVASFAFAVDAEGSEVPVVGPDGLTIVVRDIRTGATVRSFDTPVAPWDGLITRGQLLWYANAESILAPDGSDVAVWALDLRDPASIPVKVAPAKPGAWSSPLRLEDDGRVVIRGLGGPVIPEGFTQIIDVATLSLRTVKDHNVYAIDGDRAVIKRDDDWIVMDLKTGDRIGEAMEAFENYRTFATDDELFVHFGHPEPEPGAYIKAIDLQKGRVRDLLFQGRGVYTTYLMPELSTGDVLVLFDDEWESDANGCLYAAMSFLDTATGEVQPDAFAIAPPQSPIQVTFAGAD